MPNPYTYGNKKKKFPFPETPGGGRAPGGDKAPGSKPMMKDKTRMQAEEMSRSYHKGSGMGMKHKMGAKMAALKKRRPELE